MSGLFKEFSAKYGVNFNEWEWGIDLEEERLVCLTSPNLVKKLNEKELRHIRKLIKIKEDGAKR